MSLYAAEREGGCDFGCGWGECGKNGDFRESPDFFNFHVGKERVFAGSGIF
jgi:hypothetical protein